MPDRPAIEPDPHEFSRRGRRAQPAAARPAEPPPGDDPRQTVRPQNLLASRDSSDALEWRAWMVLLVLGWLLLIAVVVKGPDGDWTPNVLGGFALFGLAGLSRIALHLREIRDELRRDD